MFNPLLFIERPDRLLLSQRMCGVFTGRVVPFGNHHFWKEILVLKGSTLHSLYKEGGRDCGRAGKEGMGEGIFKASAPHYRIYSLVLRPIASLFQRVCRIIGSTVGSILGKHTICNLRTALL